MSIFSYWMIGSIRVVCLNIQNIVHKQRINTDSSPETCNERSERKERNSILFLVFIRHYSFGVSIAEMHFWYCLRFFDSHTLVHHNRQPTYAMHKVLDRRSGLLFRTTVPDSDGKTVLKKINGETIECRPLAASNSTMDARIQKMRSLLFVLFRFSILIWPMCEIICTEIGHVCFLWHSKAFNRTCDDSASETQEMRNALSQRECARCQRGRRKLKRVFDSIIICVFVARFRFSRLYFLRRFVLKVFRRVEQSDYIRFYSLISAIDIKSTRPIRCSHGMGCRATMHSPGNNQTKSDKYICEHTHFFQLFLRHSLNRSSVCLCDLAINTHATSRRRKEKSTHSNRRFARKHSSLRYSRPFGFFG